MASGEVAVQKSVEGGATGCAGRWSPRVPRLRSSRGRGAALASIIVDSRSWKHRRVDSLRLASGDRGQWRTSLDLTVPDDKRLLWPSRRDNGQLVVPLGLFTKGALRDFDTSDADGRPLTVLGLDDGRELELEILTFLVESVDGITMTEPLLDALWGVIVHDPSIERADRRVTMKDQVETMLTTGILADRTVLTQDELDRVGDVTRSFLLDLVDGYVLFALVPSSAAGQRTVIKYARYWSTDTRRRGALSQIASRRDAVLASFGVRPAILTLPVDGAGDAASFHLELHLPSEIECSLLRLPAGSARRGGLDDRRTGPVAHAHGSYEWRPNPDERWDAYVHLVPSARGTARVTVATTIATFMFFLLGLTLDGAMAVLMEASDPSAMLLTLPAAVLTLFLGVREHAIASLLLAPIRFAIGTCAVLLTLAATSLTWDLRSPWLLVFWWAALLLSGMLAVGSTVGAVARSARARRATVSPNT